jgi:hypothetical protein
MSGDIDPTVVVVVHVCARNIQGWIEIQQRRMNWIEADVEQRPATELRPISDVRRIQWRYPHRRSHNPELADNASPYELRHLLMLCVMDEHSVLHQSQARSPREGSQPTRAVVVRSHRFLNQHVLACLQRLRGPLWV